MLPQFVEDCSKILAFFFKQEIVGSIPACRSGRGYFNVTYPQIDPRDAQPQFRVPSHDRGLFPRLFRGALRMRELCSVGFWWENVFFWGGGVVSGMGREDTTAHDARVMFTSFFTFKVQKDRKFMYLYSVLYVFRADQNLSRVE